MNNEIGHFESLPDNRVRTEVFSSRGRHRKVFRCCGYEYEDIIVAELEHGKIVEPQTYNSRRFDFNAKRYLMRRGLPVNRQFFGAQTTAIGKNVVPLNSTFKAFAISPQKPRLAIARIGPTTEEFAIRKHVSAASSQIKKRANLGNLPTNFDFSPRPSIPAKISFRAQNIDYRARLTGTDEPTF